MASYNMSVEYDIECDSCGKYFSEKSEVWDLEESYTDFDYKNGNSLTYYKCDNCEGGEVLVID